MADAEKRPLKVFLCHASGDKPPVRDLYKRLTIEGVDAWLDQEKLLPGQDWRLEIPRAVHEADVVVVCLSNKSLTKEGYVQKEIKFALDIAEEKPDGVIFLIPARLEDCIVPERLSRWQWVDLYEENGFIRLLRSLKLRASAVGAVIESVSYEDTDKERERRLDQLYTEGLAAFYTEDWDRACRRFQTILSEQPNHKNAAEKLEDAECQRHFAKLYVRATESYRSENWEVAIPLLEELSQKSAGYRDVEQLLRDARKREQLTELYAEARALHAAQKWQAVVKVFDQIAIIEPNYPDADKLLASAKKEVAALERLADLNENYSHALLAMDSANWYEARQLLETIHKSQTGFLETEKLLRKVDNEILKEEEKRKQNDQINTLYEQAHGLLRSRKWRNALDKLEQIRQLDDQFSDTEGIAEKAQKELEREEQEAERQNKLAALYAESVKLLKEDKYQDALDKWQEVKALDPKYPDRQWVQRTARKELAALTKPVQNRPGFVMTRSTWLGLGTFLAIAASLLTLFLLREDGEKALSPASTVIPTHTAVQYIAPEKTRTPAVNTSEPATPFPVTRKYSALMYDDFDNAAFNGRYNKSLWEVGTKSTNYAISQDKGKLAITVHDQAGVSLVKSYSNISEPTFFEARLFLDPATTDRGSHFFIVVGNDHGYSNCGIFRTGDSAQQITCWSEYYGVKTEIPLGLDGLLPGWHMLRFEIYPETMVIHYVVDGKRVGDFNPKTSIPDHFKEFKNSRFDFVIGLNNFGPSKAPVGYIDFARMGAIKEDSLLFFDDFNGPEVDQRYGAIPAHLVSSGYRGAPKSTFELLDRSTVLKLQNKLDDGQSVGWQTNPAFNSETNPVRLEVRFNTLVQSPATSIDGFLKVWLFDGENTKYNDVGFFAGGYGRDNSFAGYNLQNKTWYRLVLTAVKGKEIRAALCDDETGKVLAEIGIGQNTNIFRFGIRIGLGQSMGTPGRPSPTEVAIDWIRLSIIPSP